MRKKAIKVIEDKNKDENFDFYKALDELFGVESHHDSEVIKDVEENIEYEEDEEDDWGDFCGTHNLLYINLTNYELICSIIAILFALTLPVRYIDTNPDTLGYLLIGALCIVQTMLSVLMVFLIRPRGLIFSIVLNFLHIILAIIGIATEAFGVQPLELLSASISIIISLILSYAFRKDNPSYPIMENPLSGYRSIQYSIHDYTTELASIFKIREEIDKLIESKTPCTVIYIGLDNFKKVNAAKGHEAGDKVIIKTSLRLLYTQHEQDICGHIASDEFVVISGRDFSENELEKYIKKLRKRLAEPFYIDDSTEVCLSASFGIARYPENGEDSTELLRKAYVALGKAKSEGKNRCVILK